MDSYQSYLFDLFKEYRPEPTYPTYPPYHQGLYLEDTFIKDFQKNNISYDRYFIPISWTTVYCDAKEHGLQEKLNQLDNSKKYFTVSQHDDAIKEILPQDTISFCAGGNAGGIPIPLICSKISNVPLSNTKDLLCSFVGSITHQIRVLMYQALENKHDCFMYAKHWNPEVKNEEKDLFLEMASRSKFLLCPRGYGLNSFRLYEAFQLGCVPVIITDKPFLPWADELVWSKFSALILPNDINNMYNILNNINQNDYKTMLDTGQKLYNDYFTLGSLYSNIVRRI